MGSGCQAIGLPLHAMVEVVIFQKLISATVWRLSSQSADVAPTATILSLSRTANMDYTDVGPG
jgi:hypothetical protein